MEVDDCLSCVVVTAWFSFSELHVQYIIIIARKKNITSNLMNSNNTKSLSYFYKVVEGPTMFVVVMIIFIGIFTNPGCNDYAQSCESQYINYTPPLL